MYLPRLSRTAIPMFGLAVIVLMHPASAEDVVVGGVNGSTGNTGASGDPGGVGGTGSVGGDAQALSISPSDYTKSAIATGGAGGNGGAGGTGVDGPDADPFGRGGNGGTGGAGGNATSKAAITGDFPFQNSVANAIANGGLGGDGGVGGAPAFSTASGGSGGVGGTASAEATGRSANATATGGRGGHGFGAGNFGGAGGVASARAKAEDRTSASTIIRGGDGGQGNDSASGGTGGRVSGFNTVDGIAGPYNFPLTQAITGGNGGSSVSGSGGNGGNGGDAASSFITDSSRNVSIYSEASGGNGGFGAAGGQGGGASSLLDLTSAGSVHGEGIARGGRAVTSTSTPGAGGFAVANTIAAGYGLLTIRAEAIGGEGGETLGTGNGGTGGAASASANGVSLGNREVTVGVRVQGGAGGRASTGHAGDGVGVHLDNAATGTTQRELILQQFAVGGDGGFSNSGTPGNAGNATSTLTVNHAGSGLRSFASAEGGRAGYDFSSPANGTDGAAVATSNVRSLGTTGASAYAKSYQAPATATAIATGSNGTNARAIALTTGAMANATSAAENSGSGKLAEAQSSALGLVGYSDSRATAGAGVISQARASAGTEVPGMVNSGFTPGMTALSTASVTGGQAQGDTVLRSNHAAAVVVGLPDTEQIQNALFYGPNLVSDIGSSSVLFYGAVGASYADEPSVTAAINQMARVDLSIDMAGFADNQPLLIGFLEAPFTGDGFDTLNFKVLKEGNSVVDVSFTDLLTAVAYFDDRLLEIHDWTNGLSGDLDLSFVLEMTTSTRFDGFSVNFISGMTLVPAPSAIWLLGTGIAALIWGRRRQAGLL